MNKIKNLDHFYSVKVLFFSEFFILTLLEFSNFICSEKKINFQISNLWRPLILTATGLLVEDAVSSFYQYFYFELYNDIEVWKRRTLMEKTIMNENFQVLPFKTCG